MKTVITLFAAIVAAASLSAGYRPSPGWPAVTTPSYNTATEAQFEARREYWQQRGLRLSPVAGTGSMKPLLSGREVLAVHDLGPAGPVQVGQMVLFVRRDTPQQQQRILASLRGSEAEAYREWLEHLRDRTELYAKIGVPAPEPMCVHYVVRVSRDGRHYYISGLSTRWSDGWIPRADVRAVVREIIRPPLN